MRCTAGGDDYICCILVGLASLSFSFWLGTVLLATALGYVAGMFAEGVHDENETQSKEQTRALRDQLGPPVGDRSSESDALLIDSKSSDEICRLPRPALVRTVLRRMDLTRPIFEQSFPDCGGLLPAYFNFACVAVKRSESELELIDPQGRSLVTILTAVLEPQLLEAKEESGPALVKIEGVSQDDFGGPLYFEWAQSGLDSAKTLADYLSNPGSFQQAP